MGFQGNKQPYQGQPYYFTNIHYDGYGPQHKFKYGWIHAPGLHPTSPKDAYEFRVFGLEWDENKLIFYYEGKAVRTVMDPKLIPNLEHFLALSGSIWDGSFVDGRISTANWNNQSMFVDYVRV